MLTPIKPYLPHFVAQAFCSPDKYKLMNKQQQLDFSKKLDIELESQQSKNEVSFIGSFTDRAVSYVPRPIKNILKNPLTISGLVVSFFLMKELYSRTVSGLETENQEIKITNGLSDIDWTNSILCNKKGNDFGVEEMWKCLLDQARNGDFGSLVDMVHNSQYYPDLLEKLKVFINSGDLTKETLKKLLSNPYFSKAQTDGNYFNNYNLEIRKLREDILKLISS